jgi:peptidase M28-like protein
MKACALLLAVLAVAGCDSARGGAGGGDDGPGSDGGASDNLQAIFDAVTRADIQGWLDELTGAKAVMVDGADAKITDRWSPAAKATFRTYWTQQMTAFGANVDVTTFPIPNLVGETEGHNLEAILPGTSPDSLVIIVHYDTVGITGKETQNPGADDDGSGLAMMLEAARIFSQHAKREKTVRFVAADYEEISDDLDGDYAYVKYIQQEAASKGFRILAASDNDQTGWSCWSENLCGTNPPAPGSTFQMISCSGDAHHYDYPELAQGMSTIATAFSTGVTPTAVCDGSGDTDHYPFWVAGIPAYVIEEWGSENNPHYDDTGHDTLDTIDFDYLTAVAKLQITFQAQLAGIE